jgi:hypothetical protein
VAEDQSQLLWGARGRGRTRKPLLLLHRIKGLGPEGASNQALGTQGITLWGHGHSRMQSE